MVDQYIISNLDDYKEPISTVLDKMYNDRVIERIWNHDYTVWKPDPAEISDRLGWLHIADIMRHEEPMGRMKKLVYDVRNAGYTNVLLLGMGGSSLAPEVLSKTFGIKRDYLAILDNTDPGAVLALANTENLSKTLFIVSTKSGTTVETISLFRYFYNRMVEAVGSKKAGEHFIAITDPGTGLVKLSENCKFRAVFLNDTTIGGRYSVFSYFGLVPAALICLGLEPLLDRAITMSRSCKVCNNLRENPGAYLGVIMGVLALRGRDKLTLIASPAIAPFGAWLEQLIAESTGKEGKGILPVDGEYPISPDFYGNDRLFVYLYLKDNAAYDKDVNELRKKKHPVIQINLDGIYDLGFEFFRWEMATAVAGYIMGVNPFDQPDVELSKKLARDMVSAYEQSGSLPASPSTLEADGIAVHSNIPANSLREAIDFFLAQAKSGDYISIQAYVQATDQIDPILQRMRIKLRDRLRLATTVGYGPRFLHSTGQLHKGGAGNGLFIQITANDGQDAPIPEEAGSPDSKITFGVLKAAQALGDQKALSKARRRMIRFHLEKDIISGLESLIKCI